IAAISTPGRWRRLRALGLIVGAVFCRDAERRGGLRELHRLEPTRMQRRGAGAALVLLLLRLLEELVGADDLDLHPAALLEEALQRLGHEGGVGAGAVHGDEAQLARGRERGLVERLDELADLLHLFLR